MSSVSRSSLRSQGGGMYETETLRLQREVDIFTQKLEHEKRKLLIVEEQIKQANVELDDRNRTVSQLKPSLLESKKTKIKMRSNTNNVNNERIKLNQTKARNEGLRREIDVLRKELRSANGEIGKLKNRIDDAKKDAESKNSEYIIGKKIAEEGNN